jgi:hypothetical protein
MLVRAPLVEAQQDSSIRIEDLTKVGMARLALGLAEERLVPFEATGDVADRPRAFHRISLVVLTGTERFNVENTLIRFNVVMRRSAVSYSVFHEKAFKLKMKFISLLC